MGTRKRTTDALHFLAKDFPIGVEFRCGIAHEEKTFNHRYSFSSYYFSTSNKRVVCFQKPGAAAKSHK